MTTAMVNSNRSIDGRAETKVLSKHFRTNLTVEGEAETGTHSDGAGEEEKDDGGAEEEPQIAPRRRHHATFLFLFSRVRACVLLGFCQRGES